MKEKVIIGIDTSNYTTSVAIVGIDGKLIANIKRPLPVKQGECGLRQSDAVFAHVKNLPLVMDEAEQFISDKEIVAVGVSDKPRNVEGSYMPCFLSGVAAARTLSVAAGVPLFRFSHQCGHIMAALYSADKMSLCDGEFAAFHVSGGTTELLHVKGRPDGFEAGIVGGTLDTSAGQIIDRIGVHLGMSFPAGPGIEKAAIEYSGKVPRKKPSVKGTYINLSGLENMAKKVHTEFNDSGMTASFVLDYIGNSIAESCDAYVCQYGEMPFVFAGGVMCNTIIRKKLENKFNAYFAEPAMSADNAVGIAVLTLRAFLK